MQSSIPKKVQFSSLSESRPGCGVQHPHNRSLRARQHRRGSHRAQQGVAARGLPSDRPLDRRTGIGRVHATTAHAYVDAQRRKHPFTLLVTESSGAFSSTLTRALRAIDTQARLKSSTDYTAYGTARHSPRTYLLLPPRRSCHLHRYHRRS